MKIATCSRKNLESHVGGDLPSYVLVSFRDPLTPEVKTPPGCKYRLDILCHDIGEECLGLIHPAKEHTKQIVEFYRHCSTVAYPPDLFIVQCEAGVGRSMAVAAALLQFQKGNYSEILRNGTYNRKLYRLMLEELGLPVPGEPLVCLAVRVKYPLDRMEAFVHSMQRQRYNNWKIIAVTDGPIVNGSFGEGYNLKVGSCIPHEKRVSLLVTFERKGLWGHPYRQLGINHCLELGAEYIGLSNDDNYYCPGYLEQMVFAMQHPEREYARNTETGEWTERNCSADFVSCQSIHSYSGWSVVGSQPTAGNCDLGAWLASADLVRQVPWEGTDFLADGRYIERLAAKAKRCVRVDKPLFVKN